MQTKLIKIDADDPNKEDMREAAEIIRSGGLVAFPTETVYGLGANALDPEASKRIYAAKGRPSDNPLIVHICRFEELLSIAKEVPPQAKKLADAFWPGPLTMIVWKNEKVPYETTGGMDTVAIRMPNHPVALALIDESGCMIAAPSANTSGKPSPTEAGHVALDLDGKIPMILDGGSVGIGIESTIIDLTEKVPMILRPGYITKEMLEEVLGEEVRIDPGIIASDSTKKPKAPGMKYKHYAPKADLVLVEGEQEAVVAEINALVREKQAAGLKVGVVATDETESLYQADYVVTIGARSDEDAKPMEQGRMRFCPDTPHLYWLAYLEDALDRGDRREAEKRANSLYRKGNRDKSDLSYIGAILRCWAYTDPERALELFAKRLEWSFGLWDQKKVYDFDKGACVCFRRLSRHQQAVHLDLPRAFPLWREDGAYSTKELANWFRAQAETISRRFDERNGSHCFGHDLAVALAKR